MKKRAFIIHGWEGYPEEGWFPWLKEELESKGCQVKIPSMPSPETPKIKTWISFLQKKAPKPDQNTYFVGHSIGCQAIMRYLELLPDKTRVGGIVFVAGFFDLVGLTKEEIEIVRPWLETPIDTRKVRQRAKGISAIFSTNDPWVPLSQAKVFKKRLKAKVIIEKDKGHFSGDDGITQLPSALKELLGT